MSSRHTVRIRHLAWGVLAAAAAGLGIAGCRDSPTATARGVAPDLVIAATPAEGALQQRLFGGIIAAGPTQGYLQYSSVNPTPDRRHSGVDYGGERPVYAPVSGIVRGVSSACGAVVIEDERALSTWPGATARPRHVFLHMKDLRVAAGQRVAAGTRLGTSWKAAGGGCVATGSHLHYEIRRDYTGTSGVGRTSCGSKPGCTTATLTYDPRTYPYPGAPTPTPPTPPQQRVEIIVDDVSGGFTRAGTPSYWKQASIGWSGHMFYTLSDQSRIDNQGTWRPALTSAVRGDYTVSVFIPRNYATTRAATYTIYHDGRAETRVINQFAYSDVWVTLGRFYFRGDGSEYVRLVDRTGESNTARRMVGFDAVKFTP